LIILEAFRTALILKESRRVIDLNLFWILALRDFWRGMGMFSGIIRFFILDFFKR